MNTITVKAAEGLLVPREDNHRTYITETEAVTVPASTYYQRRIAEGDLVQVESAQLESSEPPKPNKSGKSKGEQ